MCVYTYGVLGKFTPIPGFMHFSAPEALPTDRPDPTLTAPKGSR